MGSDEGSTAPEGGAGQSEQHEDRSSSPAAVALPISKSGKQCGKETGISLLNSVNKSTSQIRKHPHRKSGSPLDWFPRKKVDSFLKRKIKLLQQEGGDMSLSLDETLGGANPHYSRIAREKIAARQAAHRAMAALKAAMVEESWCRILKAARIQSKEADADLLKAEKCVVEAFEVAAAMGVMMYDRPDCPRRPAEVETSFASAGGSTHTLSASFQTAFEVDREVAAAVKEAFVRLANSPPSSNKEEFRDLLRKISENPDNEWIHMSEGGSELDDVNRQASEELRESKNDQPSLGVKCFRELVDVMFDRLKRLQEDEISSLAVIVATRGLNSALVEMESGKESGSGPRSNISSDDSSAIVYRRSSSTTGMESRRYCVKSLMEGPMKRKGSGAEVLGLEKYLVKHLSRLEKEVVEARNSKKDSSKAEEKDQKAAHGGKDLVEEIECLSDKHQRQGIDLLATEGNSESSFSDGKEKDKENIELNKKSSIEEGVSRNKSVQLHGSSPTVPRRPLSRIERAKLEVLETFSSKDGHGNSLDEILVKPVGKLEREKMQQALERGKDDAAAMGSSRRRANESATHFESLDKVLVKHVSRLEKEKLAALEAVTEGNNNKAAALPVGKIDQKVGKDGAGLAQVLVKHQSGLEKAKSTAASNPTYDINKVDRWKVKEKELSEAWGGLSLENSFRPRLSRLEREKAAWKKKEEEEERMRLTGL